MALTAILLSQATLGLDQWIGDKWLKSWELLSSSQPEGAREILSTIAGSMIGVAGVTFSITIAAVAYASTQFGPRIIDNFMQDRGNQVTLGTFISTYLYCLLVLRTVTQGSEGPAFVPHGSLMVAVALAVASLGVLIYFIHHIPESIHVSNVVAAVGRQLLDQVDELYPQGGNEPEPERDSFEGTNPKLSQPIQVLRSPQAGYIQSVEGERLVSLASDSGALIKLSVEPGFFVAPNTILGRVYGEMELNPKALRNCFVIGPERSPTQDIRCLMDQLVDIAGRALSPGVNDPFTAIACIDWLGAVMAKLGEREMPSRFRLDQSARVCLVVSRPDFEDLVDAYWDKLRPYVEVDRNAAFHMLESAVTVMSALPPERAVHLHRAAQRLVEGCLEHLKHPREIAQLAELREKLAQANSTQTWARKAEKAYRITA